MPYPEDQYPIYYPPDITTGGINERYPIYHPPPPPEPSWAQTIAGTGISLLPTMIGTALGGPVGGAAGAAVGSLGRQWFEQNQTDQYGRPLRQDYNFPLAGVEGAFGAIGGLNKFPGFGAAEEALLKYGVGTSLEGAALSGVSEPFIDWAETGKFDPNLQRMGQAAGPGALMATALGFGTEKYLAGLRPRPEAPPPPPGARMPPPPRNVDALPGMENVDFGAQVPETTFTPPPAPQIDPALQRRQGMAAIDSQAQQQMFELQLLRSEAQRAGDVGAVTQLEQQMLDIRMRTEEAKRNWQPPPPPDTSPAVFPDITGEDARLRGLTYRGETGRFSQPIQHGVEDVIPPATPENSGWTFPPPKPEVNITLNPIDPNQGPPPDDTGAGGVAVPRPTPDITGGQSGEVPTPLPGETLSQFQRRARLRWSEAERIYKGAQATAPPQEPNAFEAAMRAQQAQLPEFVEVTNMSDIDFIRGWLAKGYRPGPPGKYPRLYRPDVAPPVVPAATPAPAVAPTRAGAFGGGVVRAGDEIRRPTSTVNEQYIQNMEKSGYTMVEHGPIETVFRKLGGPTAKSEVPQMGDISADMKTILSKIFTAEGTKTGNLSEFEVRRIIREIVGETDGKAALNRANEINAKARETHNAGDAETAEVLGHIADAAELKYLEISNSQTTVEPGRTGPPRSNFEKMAQDTNDPVELKNLHDSLFTHAITNHGTMDHDELTHMIDVINYIDDKYAQITGQRLSAPNQGKANVIQPLPTDIDHPPQTGPRGLALSGDQPLIIEGQQPLGFGPAALRERSQLENIAGARTDEPVDLGPQPTQQSLLPRDTSGRAESSNPPNADIEEILRRLAGEGEPRPTYTKEEIIKRFKDNLPPAGEHWGKTRFLLPSGERLTHDQEIHAFAAERDAGVHLDQAMDAGIIRIAANFRSAEVYSTITRAQAQVMSDAIHMTGRKLEVEVLDSKGYRHSRMFNEESTAGDIMSWTNGRLKNPGPPRAVSRIGDFLGKLRERVLNTAWNSMKVIAGTKEGYHREIVIDDPDHVLTSGELSAMLDNPLVKQAHAIIDDIIQKIIETSGNTTIGPRLSRVGTSVDATVFGTHTQNTYSPNTKSALALNLAEHILQRRSPDEAAIMLLDTIYHELGHVDREGTPSGKYNLDEMALTDPYVGRLLQDYAITQLRNGSLDPHHGLDWLGRVGDLYGDTGPEFFTEQADTIRRLLEWSSEPTGNYRPEVQDFLQLYTTAKRRVYAEVTPSTRSEAQSANPKPGREGPISSDAEATRTRTANPTPERAAEVRKLLLDGLPKVSDIRNTRFVAPDGTKLAFKGDNWLDTHGDTARSLGSNYEEVQKSGMMRWSGDSAEVMAPISREQAQFIADSRYRGGHTQDVYVDVTSPDGKYYTKLFDERATAAGIREWINSKFRTERAESARVDEEGNPIRKLGMFERVKQNTGWGQGATVAPKRDPNAPNFMKEVINLPTNFTTTGDLSWPGRQGLSQMMTPEFWKSIIPALSSVTEKGANKIDAELRNKEIFAPRLDENTGKAIPSIGEEAGLDLMAYGHHAGPREENTASRWIETGGFLGPESIGGVPNPFRFLYKHTLGVPARATNRIFTTFGNHFRANRFETLMNLSRNMAGVAESGRGPMQGILGGIQLKSGQNIGFKRSYTEEEAAHLNPFYNKLRAKEIADFVNTASGRGPLRMHVLPHRSTEMSLEKASGILGYALFAPKNTFSRMRMLNPNTYIMASPFVRKQYLKAALSTAAAWWVFTEMAKMADPDASVSHDLTSADFGKVRIGDFRLDPAGGFQQFLVAYARLYQGGAASSSTGQFHRFGEGYQAQTQFDMGERLFANKLNPVAKFAWDLAHASQYNPFHVGDRTVQMFVPLIVQDFYEIQKENPELLVPWMAPILFGQGSQIYSKGESISKFISPENDKVITGGGLIDTMPEGVQNMWNASGRY